MSDALTMFQCFKSTALSRFALLNLMTIPCIVSGSALSGRRVVHRFSGKSLFVRRYPRLETHHGVCHSSGRPEDGQRSALDEMLFRAAEVLGMVVGTSGIVQDQRDGSQYATLLTLDDAVGKIRRLYDSSYFFSGQGDDEDWDVFQKDCEFADEFSSFRGAGRFRRNVSNFGRVLIDPRCTLVKLETITNDDDSVQKVKVVVSWVFKARVVWTRGLLAAAGETTYILNSTTGRVSRHEERWKTSKTTVLKNILFNTQT